MCRGRRRRCAPYYSVVDERVSIVVAQTELQSADGDANVGEATVPELRATVFLGAAIYV